MVSQGRTREAFTSEWHWLQATFTWREPDTSVTLHEHAASIGGLEAGIGVAAHAIGVGHALRVENVADFVRLMAIDAGGKNIGLFFPELAADGLAVHQFDFGVAFGAGGRDVAPVDGRVRIGVRQDDVRRVTRGTVGGDDQSPFLSKPSPWMLSV